MAPRVFPEFDLLSHANVLHRDRRQKTEDGGRFAPDRDKQQHG